MPSMPGLDELPQRSRRRCERLREITSRRDKRGQLSFLMSISSPRPLAHDPTLTLSVRLSYRLAQGHLVSLDDVQVAAIDDEELLWSAQGTIALDLLSRRETDAEITGRGRVQDTNESLSASSLCSDGVAYQADKDKQGAASCIVPSLSSLHLRSQRGESRGRWSLRRRSRSRSCCC